MKTKCVVAVYMIQFLWSTLTFTRMFSKGTVNSSARVVSVFRFSPHICKHGGWTVASARWRATASGNQDKARQKAKSSSVSSGERGGQVMGRIMPVHLH